MPIRHCACFIAIVASTAVQLASASDAASLDYFRALAETRNYTLGRPVAPKITPDGRHAFFIRALPRDRTLRLVEFELATGRPSV
jgi:dipeptidyl-peptidase 4